MIGNITKGGDFGGLFKYLLHPDKEGVIIGGNVGASSPPELEAEFLTFSNLNSRVKKIVTHISLGFAPLDGVVDPQTQARIADRIVVEMGYGNSQYLVVAHGRNDPGHDEPHNHDHIHIVANSVDLAGKFVNDRLNYPRLEKILRQIEKDEELTQIKSSWEVKKRAPTHGQTQRYKREQREVAAGERETATLPVSDRLQMAIDLAAKESSSIVDFAQTLAERGIGTKLKITRTGLVRGISYSLDGVNFQGNQLYDASLPKLQSVRGLSFDPKTDPNRLRQISPNPNPQPMMLSEDRGSNFPQNIPGSRPRDGSPLPEFLQMLEKAENEVIQDVNSEGDSSGVPDVNDKKNLKILEEVAKTEDEVAQIDRADETTKQQTQKNKPRTRSNQLG